MKVKILDQAEADLIEGFHFYETQQTGIGGYFLANLYADIESLRLYGGIHLQSYKNYHRPWPVEWPCLFHRAALQKVSLCDILHGGGQNCFHPCHRGLSP